MTQLRQDYDKFKERDTIVVVIGPEGKEKFKEYWEKNDLPFVGLPNEEHDVLKQYGQEVKILKLGRMPAQMIIDKEGILQYIHYGDSMKDIPENKEIISLLDNLHERK